MRDRRRHKPADHGSADHEPGDRLLIALAVLLALCAATLWLIGYFQ